MSAGELRRAASVMRAAWLEAAEETAALAAAGRPVGTMAPTMVAVADWLEAVADRDPRGLSVEAEPALSVARAYLGA